MNLSTRLLALSALFGGAVLSTSAIAADLKVPNQFPTIQAAIDASNPGDKIRISPGTYDEDLRLENRQDLALKGDDGVFVRSLFAVGSDEIAIKEITFTASVAAGPAANTQALIIACEQLDLRFCRFEGENTPGLAIQVSSVTIRDTAFAGPSDAGLFLEATQATVSRATFEPGNDLFLSVCDGVLVEESEMTGMQAFIAGSENVTFLDNTFEGSRLSLDLLSGFVVDSNRFIGGENAIHLLECSQGVISGNRVKKTVGTSIVLEDSQDVLVKKNKVKASGAVGLLLDVNSASNVIKKNVVKKSAGFDLIDDNGQNKLVKNVFGTADD